MAKSATNLLFLLLTTCSKVQLINYYSSSLSVQAYQISSSRKLDIARSCQEELSTLRQSAEFKVEFPTLSEFEFMEHCNITINEISCELYGTSLINDFRAICEDNAGGKLVLMNMTASGECVGSMDVIFYDFPLCAGKSCDEQNLIESYEEKQRTEGELMGSNCILKMKSGGHIANINSYIMTATISLGILVYII